MTSGSQDGVFVTLPAWARALHELSPPYELRHRLLQIVVDLVEEAGGREPLLLGADEEREVFRHKAGLDRVDAYLLQGGRELGERRVVVELGAVGKPARPGEDRGDRVGRGLLALLMLAVVARHRAVRGFRLPG